MAALYDAVALLGGETGIGMGSGGIRRYQSFEEKLCILYSLGRGSYICTLFLYGRMGDDIFISMGCSK
jgi:hypothetical protein